MGLDMSLYGEKYDFSMNGEREMVDGYPLHKTTIELAYWRKHPNLHGYIVEEFADGEDECQKIELSDNDIRQIIEAIKNDNLPFTEGFFFGRSSQKGEPEYEEEKKHDIEVFNKALDWVNTKGNTPGYRSIYYQASW